MAWQYYNPTTGQTATTDSDKADKDGNIHVCIDNVKYIQMNYNYFISNFHGMTTESDNDKYNQSNQTDRKDYLG